MKAHALQIGLVLLLLVAVIVSALTNNQSLPPSCTTEGFIRDIEVNKGDRIQLDKEYLEWNGEALYVPAGSDGLLPDNYHSYGKIEIGDGIFFGDTGDPVPGINYRWALIRCTKTKFRIWDYDKFNALPRPTPIPQATPAVTFP